MIAAPVIDTPFNFSYQKELISNQGNKFLIELKAENNKNLNLIAKIINNENIFQKVYINDYSVEKIKENKYFLQFDNLSEICNELSERIKNEKISLIENDKSIAISIPLNTTKIKDITFELNKKEFKENEIMDNIISLILKQNKEIGELKQKNKDIEKLLNEKTKEINQLKIQINELKEKFNKFENINKNNKNINQENNQINNIESKINTQIDSLDIFENLNSVIIKDNKEYIKTLKNWIAPNKKIKSKLLYRLTENGNLSSEFHKRCDNKGSTLTLFNLVDGKIMGIYTPLSWETNQAWKKDMNSFIFSLNENQKYKKIKELYSIYCNKTSGPCAGNLACEGPYLSEIYNRKVKLFEGYYENDKKILENQEKPKLIDIEVFEVAVS